MKSQMEFNSTSSSTPATNSSPSNYLGPSIFDSFAANTSTAATSPNPAASTISPAPTDLHPNPTTTFHAPKNANLHEETSNFPQSRPTHRPSRSRSRSLSLLDSVLEQNVFNTNDTNRVDIQARILVNGDIAIEPSPTKRRKMSSENHSVIFDDPFGEESPLFEPLTFEPEAPSFDSYNIGNRRMSHPIREHMMTVPHVTLPEPPLTPSGLLISEFQNTPLTNLYHCSKCTAEVRIPVKSNEQLVCNSCGGRMFWKAPTTKTRRYFAW
jgi:DNA-directed RNA polymerase subunit RPC12/RpoP